uniref:Uncharacterized protein n=1 Tax=Anopheles coluzzii TaxID=1518534 RepID=A0A8W7PUB3_ANOCL
MDGADEVAAEEEVEAEDMMLPPIASVVLGYVRLEETTEMATDGTTPRAAAECGLAPNGGSTGEGPLVAGPTPPYAGGGKLGGGSAASAGDGAGPVPTAGTRIGLAPPPSGSTLGGRPVGGKSSFRGATVCCVWGVVANTTEPPPSEPCEQDKTGLAGC